MANINTKIQDASPVEEERRPKNEQKVVKKLIKIPPHGNMSQFSVKPRIFFNCSLVRVAVKVSAIKTLTTAQHARVSLSWRRSKYHGVHSHEDNTTSHERVRLCFPLPPTQK